MKYYTMSLIIALSLALPAKAQQSYYSPFPPLPAAPIMPAPMPMGIGGGFGVAPFAPLPGQMPAWNSPYAPTPAMPQMAPPPPLQPVHGPLFRGW
jgi:hypothetical protein